jgi:predicted RNase H-like nuclease (RuvC/YqgF family)
MAKIRQELDEAWNENEILKLKLEQLKVEQSLQTDCRRELRESQSENDELKYELKCSKLEPSSITGNTFTSISTHDWQMCQY